MKSNNSKQRGIYIHIPLCDYMCPYCNYEKTLTHNKKYVNEYIDCVVQEIENIKIEGCINTIYIGGGSPNSISDENIKKLLSALNNKINLQNVMEFTIEAKPQELTKNRITLLKNYQVNRISMPIQSLDEENLGLMYSEEKVKKSISNLYKEGINNINIDLLFPLSSKVDLEEFIKKMNTYNISHITLLPIEEFIEDCEYSQNEVYRKIIELLENSGYSQYDLLHFSKKGFENIHNSNYWRRKEYYALGAGAHGFIDGVRYSNYGDVREYIRRIVDKQNNIEEFNELSFNEAIEEEFYLGLQLLKGIDIDEINLKYSIDTLELYNSAIKKHISLGNLEIKKKFLKLTRRGVINSDDVLSEFLS